jgi:hypothetical protein
VRSRAVVGLLLAAALLASACTSGGPSAPLTASPSPVLQPASPESPSPVADGAGSAQAALERLCDVPPPKGNRGSDVPPEGPTPPAIEQVMHQVAQIRGFPYDHPVVAEPVTQAQIARGFQKSLDASFPVDLYERRSQAWQTIGVIPPGTEIRDEVSKYGSSQVIGYYDTESEKLVFLGDADPSPLERITLAHELTHAIDDQRFGLERVDALGSKCEDEAAEAALGLIEGNATYFMYDWARTFLSPDQQLDLAREAADQAAPPSNVAPFIEDLQIWPYTAGQRFVTQLVQRGGLEAVNHAFERFPVSTEQIMHPERFPNDVPTPVDVPELSSELGSGFQDLDVMDVGEMWLNLLLSQRLDSSVADAAAAGWDGGIYRAWSDGNDVAVVLQTTWDTEQDAAEFHDAMQDWIEGGNGSGTVLEPQGKDVRVLFASDPSTLDTLDSAAA